MHRLGQQLYNNQKSSFEATAAKLLQLHDVLRPYGPEAEPVREQLKASAIKTHDEDWGSGSETLPTIAESGAAIDALARRR